MTFSSINCSDLEQSKSCCSKTEITCCVVEVQDNCCYENKVILQFDFETLLLLNSSFSIFDNYPLTIFHLNSKFFKETSILSILYLSSDQIFKYSSTILFQQFRL